MLQCILVILKAYTCVLVRTGSVCEADIEINGAAEITMEVECKDFYRLSFELAKGLTYRELNYIRTC